MNIQMALAEVINKFGEGMIPLHRSDYTNQLSSEAVKILIKLPWAVDDTGEIKYAVRHVDEIINLEVWR